MDMDKERALRKAADHVAEAHIALTKLRSTLEPGSELRGVLFDPEFHGFLDGFLDRLGKLETDMLKLLPEDY